MFQFFPFETMIKVKISNIKINIKSNALKDIFLFKIMEMQQSQKNNALLKNYKIR